jgi:hypothetical protein
MATVDTAVQLYKLPNKIKYTETTKLYKYRDTEFLNLGR